MASLGPHSLKLPRLHVREELVKARPELAELLDEQERRVGSVARPGLAGKVRNVQMTMTSAAGRSLLAGSLLEEEVSQAELLGREIEAVKAERAQLLQQLAQVKSDPGKAGGDLQQEDIQHLRTEVQIKKAKLNELHEEVLAKQKEVAQLVLMSQDCARLMPDGSPEAQSRLAQLKAEHQEVDVELAEAEAKHRLYTLLEARTKRELMAMASGVAEAQHMQRLYEEDEAALLLYVHAVKAALENALKEKQQAARHYEDTHADWTRKLRDRHKEVRELQRRQQEDAAQEERRLKALADKEAAEREKKAQLRVQEEAFALKLQAIQPKLEALEEAWSRLHTITGADTPDALIAFWKSLKVQEESMHELARMAEARQAESKLQVEALLAERYRLLEAASTAPDQSLEAAADDHRPLEALETAARRSEVAKKHFGKLRDICIGAQQGLQAIGIRLDAALSRLAGKVSSPSRRRSSEVSLMGKLRKTASIQRQGSLRRTGSGSVRKEAASLTLPSGTKLLRMYTIDQDDFFPDLPRLVQDTTEKVQALMELASKMGLDDLTTASGGEASGDAADDTTLRRRIWTGPSSRATLAQTQGPAETSPLQKKGQDGGKVDLSRLVGYTEEPALTSSGLPTTAEQGEGEEWDGVVSRHIIRNRTAKIVQKHRAATMPKTAKH